MADTSTPTYAFTLPEIGASEDTWGTKLNANWSKINTLLLSGFTGGTASTIGKLKPANFGGSSVPALFTDTITIENTSPAIRFHETDALGAAGQWQLSGYGVGSFALWHGLTANFATTETVLRFFDTKNIQADWAFSFTEGISFGSTVVGTVGNLAKHIDLYGGGYGFSVSAGQLNYVTPSGADHNFIINNVLAARISVAGTSAPSAQTVMTREKGDARFYNVGEAIPQTALPDPIVASLTHKQHGGYLQVGSYDASTGTGFGRIHWNQNNFQFNLTSPTGDANFFAKRVFSDFLIGDGDNIYNIDARDIVRVNGGVGSYRWLFSPASGQTGGTSYAGSSLANPNLVINTGDNSLGCSFGAGPSGTWVAMQTGSATANQRALGLFLRIA